ncbi:MAG: RNA methyltransferase [Bacteroidetes bacterium]|nr:MAG: RNA methyltransferase [Bacteroidota bacterium]
MEKLPESFIKTLELILKNELKAFIQALSETPPTSIRKNAKKATPFAQNSPPVLWNPDRGRYLDTRPVFTLDPAFHAGAYYVQEASSQFPAHAFRHFFAEKKPLKVLDLCAAPGGKSTLLADELSDESLLIANEVIRGRYAILRQNVQKWGRPNVWTTNHDARDFAPLAGFFDLVLVDAPCSGEGLFRKDKAAISEWSPSNVQLCSARQKRILSEAAALVAPGGFLFYCTCTYNACENDENARFITQQFDFQTVKPPVSETWGLVETPFGFQFFPHRVRGEGFYFAAFQKQGGAAFSPKKIKSGSAPKWRPLPRKSAAPLEPFLDGDAPPALFETTKGTLYGLPPKLAVEAGVLLSVLGRAHFGVELGRIKGRDLVPEHALALSTFMPKDFPAVELDLAGAHAFLKKETLPVPPGLPAGWALARYEGLALGWLKILKTRVNNYFPKSWRIRMDIS